MFKCLEEKIKKNTRVRIKSCKATLRHGKNEKLCVCDFIGRIVEVGNPQWKKNPDAPITYHVQIDGQNKFITRAEFSVLKNTTAKKKKK